MSKITLKAGARVKSAVSDVQLMAIKIPPGEYELNCGGMPMVAVSDEAEPAEIQAGAEGEVLMGKRYVDEGETVEFLCTKPGGGALSLNEQSLVVKHAKQLPSSD